MPDKTSGLYFVALTHIAFGLFLLSVYVFGAFFSETPSKSMDIIYSLFLGVVLLLAYFAIGFFLLKKNKNAKYAATVFTALPLYMLLRAVQGSIEFINLPSVNSLQLGFVGVLFSILFLQAAFILSTLYFLWLDKKTVQLFK